jgi:hypothetical protein
MTCGRRAHGQKQRRRLVLSTWFVAPHPPLRPLSNQLAGHQLKPLAAYIARDTNLSNSWLLIPDVPLTCRLAHACMSMPPTPSNSNTRALAAPHHSTRMHPAHLQPAARARRELNAVELGLRRRRRFRRRVADIAIALGAPAQPILLKVAVLHAREGAEDAGQRLIANALRYAQCQHYQRYDRQCTCQPAQRCGPRQRSWRNEPWWPAGLLGSRAGTPRA